MLQSLVNQLFGTVLLPLEPTRLLNCLYDPQVNDVLLHDCLRQQHFHAVAKNAMRPDANSPNIEEQEVCKCLLWM